LVEDGHVARQLGDLLLEEEVLGFHVCQAQLEVVVSTFDGLLLVL
jgi:hypothetical protein